jgi:NADPH-dependent 2,4-dienoyl-CoA reductase/sulfur reductase-like enzyme
MTTLGETIEYAKVIQDYIDPLHVSRGLLEVDELLPYINAPVYLPRALNLPFAKQFKQALKIPVSVVGSFDLDIAEKAIGDGDVDMVAMIRTILADTDCVEKARRGHDADIRPCIRCNVCISRTHSMFETVRCSVNPLIGRETRFDTAHPARQPKNVVIVGGGPAGLETARTAAARGHSVTLFESDTELGGAFRLACAADFKSELRDYLDWSIRTVTDSERVNVRLGTAATRELVESIAPDALIVAVGAEPIIPGFTASGTDKVVWVGDAEENTDAVGGDVVIAGAGFTGLEFALALSRQGKKVRIIDLLPEDKIGQGGAPISMIALKALLQEANVEIRCNVRLDDVTDTGAHIKLPDGTTELLACDTVVLSLGFRANPAALSRFDGVAVDTYLVGDCAGRPGTVQTAVRTGFDAAMRL